jgi:beta-galactosidase
MAQEQLHAGLLRPDGAEAQGLIEARQVAAELVEAPEVAPARAPVALIFDYDADWAWTVQPHGAGLSYFELVFDMYRALRRAGLSVDVLPPDPRGIEGYPLIAAPGLMHMPEALKAQLSDSGAVVVLGPRSGARDATMRIPVPLPPAMPGLDATVSHVESLRPDTPVALRSGGAIRAYREVLETGAEILEATEDGEAAAVVDGDLIYVAGWLDEAAMARLVREACARARLATLDLPPGVRRRDTGAERFWFNHGTRQQEVAGMTLRPLSVTREPLDRRGPTTARPDHPRA